MKRFALIGSVLVLLVLGGYMVFTSNDNSEEDLVLASQKAEYKKVAAEEAQGVLAGDEPYILLDVRTLEEYDEGHIEGALLLPDYEIATAAEQLIADKNVRILVYCRSGARSEGAARALIELGYQNVLDMGGLVDWPGELVDGD